MWIWVRALTDLRNSLAAAPRGVEMLKPPNYSYCTDVMSLSLMKSICDTCNFSPLTESVATLLAPQTVQH